MTFKSTQNTTNFITMPSDVIIKMECPSYLRKFLGKLYGEMPIDFPKGSPLLRTLEHLLNRPPKEFHEDSNYEGMLLIRLPYFDSKNVIYNNYLSKCSKTYFIIRLTRYFKSIFQHDMDESKNNGYNIKESINIFIDKFDLNEDLDIYSTLEKDYLRFLHKRNQINSRRKKVKRKVKKMSSV